MDKPLKQELIDFSAYVKSDTVFTAYARLLQSKWREKKGYPMGKSKDIVKNGIKYENYYGNYIEDGFARKNGCNFFVKKIWDIAIKKWKMQRLKMVW